METLFSPIRDLTTVQSGSGVQPGSGRIMLEDSTTYDTNIFILCQEGMDLGRCSPFVIGNLDLFFRPDGTFLRPEHGLFMRGLQHSIPELQGISALYQP